jgi:Clp amino terminal domain, pathogenicity island component
VLEDFFNLCPTPAARIEITIRIDELLQMASCELVGTGHLMFERFTERARRVVVVAVEEARRLDDNFIGTEHILLGLIHVADGRFRSSDDCISDRVFESLSIPIEDVRFMIEGGRHPGAGAPAGNIPFAPASKRFLNWRFGSR